jgi:hypothetical protein
MAAVTLDQLYLHDAADLADYIAHPLEPTSWQPAVPAVRRVLAAGRRRLVRRTGRDDTVTITLRHVPTALVVRLEDDWPGRLLLLREPRGRVWWGFYDQVAVEELVNPAEDLHTITFTFQRLTGSPAVV